MKRKVTYAKLHDLNVVLPGVGGIGRDLPPTNKTVKLEMTFEDEVLVLKINGQEHGIPAANVQFMSFAPEETK